MTSILVATESTVIAIDAERATVTTSAGLGDRPTCLAADPLRARTRVVRYGIGAVSIAATTAARRGAS